MKKPTWPEIEALAVRHNVQYSVRELQRFTRDCAFPPDLIAKFWPKATPRRLAMVQGLTRYHGAPCKQHDQTERFVSNSICVICNTERVRAAHLRDPAAHRLRVRAWQLANAQYRKSYKKAQYQKNREAAA